MADVFSVSMGVGQTGVGSSPTILKGDPSLANPVNVVKTVSKWHDKKFVLTFGLLFHIEKKN
jgi:hypothetical protein